MAQTESIHYVFLHRHGPHDWRVYRKTYKVNNATLLATFTTKGAAAAEVRRLSRLPENTTLTALAFAQNHQKEAN